MMGKFVRILFVSLFVLFGVSNVYSKPIKPPEYLKYVKEISRQFEKEIKKEYGLLCIGSGGSMPHDVEEIEIDCISYQNTSIEKARDLEVKATEKLLTIINNNKNLRPFLREYPFKHARAKVSIAFRKKDNTRFTDDSVTLVFQAKGNLFYCKYDALKNHLVDLAKEPYEEALKKVQSRQ